ncbi:MAG: DUF1080 domain-containing protein [Kiritimatiellae bacterium]|nr:DUF1080 domain-containing protein [Kiritimatiellia bacterium]
MRKTVLMVMGFAALAAVAELDQETLQSESKLLEVLQNSETSMNDKVTACQNLGWYGTEKSIAPLIALLKESRPELRHAARYGLEMIPDPAVETHLCRIAGELSGPALTGVLQSMGNRGNAESVKILIAQMRNSDQQVAAAATQALGKLATPEAVAALKGALGTHPYVAEAYLTAAGQIAAAVPAQAAACYADIRNAKAGVTSSMRLAATRGEIVTTGDAGLKLWDGAIASSDSDMVFAALRAVLDYPKNSTATAHFAASLAKVPAQQTTLATVLGQRGDRAATPALVALAEGEKAANLESRLAAATALAALNDPAGIPALLNLAKDANQDIANAAKEQLMGFAGKAGDDAVLTMMADADPAARLAGIDMALRRRMSVAVPALVKLTTDADAKIVSEAVKGLGSLGTEREIPALLAVITKKPADDTAVRALSSLCARYARPRAGKTVVKSAVYGNFEHNLTKDVTENVQKLVDAGSITIQATGRLCRWDGFSEDPSPGKIKALRLVYLFDGTEKSVQVRENDSVHLSGETLLPVALNPIKAAYDAATGEAKRALFTVLTALSNEQALGIAREAAAQKEDAALQEAAIRALVDWKTPEALDDAAGFAENAPTDRLKILAMRGFVRQLELNFTIPIQQKAARLKEAQAWAVRDEDKTFLASALKVYEKLAAEQGFQPMFNGKDLSEWSGGDGWWSAKDGILQGQSFEDKPCKKTCHLIWKGGEPGDFELRAEFRLSPEANSGIQVRAKNQVFGDSGYQGDMNGAGNYVGFLYHPAQHLVGQRGAKVVINDKGEKTTEVFADSNELQKKVFQADDWNSYAIICKGPSIKIFVNGMLTSDFEDHRPDTPRKGFISLQMHAGPPMKIQFRNLRIKTL